MTYTPPPIKAFDRLQVTDGLLVNADRWRQAHEYHRQRQNFHYQALHQPGIVCGLGVHLMAAPADVPLPYRDGRWIRIQPGIAIDAAGNPIVVPQAETYRITADVSTQEPITVYLVVRYVDPDHLTRKEPQETVRETFRIDEKTSPPDEREVEVCRLLLQPGTTQLHYPADVFFPGPNTLDLRHRISAQSRPQAYLQVAQVVQPGAIADRSDRSATQLASLLESLTGLYPALHAEPVIRSLTLEDTKTASHTYDLLYLSGEQALTLSEQQFVALGGYLQSGGTLLVEVPPQGAALAKSMMDFAQQLGTPLEYLEQLTRNHPLRSQPFLFAALPVLNGESIRVLTGGGIVMVLGQLSAGWGLDESLRLDRSTIRTAQEFGINLLKFAWRRRHMTTLLSQHEPVEPPATSQPPSSAPSADYSPSKLRSVLDQLIDPE